MQPAVHLSSAVALAMAMALTGPAIAQDRGLSVPSGGLADTRWQARLEHDSVGQPLRGNSALMPQVGSQQTLRLLGDYQFDALRLGQTGGLRLTGGLLINLRAQGYQASSANEPAPTLPYAGVGYAIGGTGSGVNASQWGFSADLGLAAGGLGLSLANRNGGTGLSVDGNLRDLRLQPMIRLGMSLSF